MRFSIFGFTALAAIVAASPVPAENLEARSVCQPPPTTTTVVGSTTTTLTGPFKLTASISGTAIPEINGKYAKFNPHTYQNVVFGTYGISANDFFLGSSGQLYGLNATSIWPASQYLYKGTSPHVRVTKTIGTDPTVVCSINTTSCAFNCNVNGASSNYLASVSDQPDWALTADKAACGLGCVPFQPYVVPAQKTL